MAKKYYFLFLLLAIGFESVAQNLYDVEHTRQFADYLLKTQQYQFAAEEYQRVLFLNPSDEKAKLSLLETYRLGKSYQQGINMVETLFGNKLDTLPEKFADIYSKLLIQNKSTDRAIDFLSRNKTFDPDKRTEYQLGALLLDKRWESAYGYVTTHQPVGTIKYAQLLVLTNECHSADYKRPALAASLSAILPGSGKIYSRQWKDGLLSLLLVSVNAWQSYRGFSKYGSRSAYGWVFGTLAVGFYTGNIYGSYQAAKNFNTKRDEYYLRKTETIFYTDF